MRILKGIKIICLSMGLISGQVVGCPPPDGFQATSSDKHKVWASAKNKNESSEKGGVSEQSQENNNGQVHATASSPTRFHETPVTCCVRPVKSPSEAPNDFAKRNDKWMQDCKYEPSNS